MLASNIRVLVQVLAQRSATAPGKEAGLGTSPSVPVTHAENQKTVPDHCFHRGPVLAVAAILGSEKSRWKEGSLVSVSLPFEEIQSFQKRIYTFEKQSLDKPYPVFINSTKFKIKTKRS